MWRSFQNIWKGYSHMRIWILNWRLYNFININVNTFRHSTRLYNLSVGSSWTLMTKGLTGLAWWNERDWFFSLFVLAPSCTCESWATHHRHIYNTEILHDKHCFNGARMGECVILLLRWIHTPSLVLCWRAVLIWCRAFADLPKMS